MNNLKIYENQGFEHGPADYVFDNIEFIGTCVSYPEQYDVVLAKDGRRYQVGYVRLRGGKLRVECPDVYGKIVYSGFFEDSLKGVFDDEEERLEHLESISEAIEWWLKGEGYEY